MSDSAPAFLQTVLHIGFSELLGRVSEVMIQWMVPVDNKMIFSFLFLTNICLVLEAWLAAASSIWNALELMFQWHKLGKADHWRLFQWKAQVWRKCSVCAANICLNKEALFYQNSPEDHNNGILMCRLLLYRVSLSVLFMAWGRVFFFSFSESYKGWGGKFHMNPLGPQQLAVF